ncbi:hypothetical protein D3C78_1281550 [compost metagenome]
MLLGTPTLSRVRWELPWRRSSARRWTRCRRSTRSLTAGRKASASGVTISRPLRRRNMAKPRCSSSCPSSRLTADCDRPRRVAAPMVEPVSMMARKASNCFRFTARSSLGWRLRRAGRIAQCASLISLWRPFGAVSVCRESRPRPAGCPARRPRPGGPVPAFPLPQQHKSQQRSHSCERSPPPASWPASAWPDAPFRPAWRRPVSSRTPRVA